MTTPPLDVPSSGPAPVSACGCRARSEDPHDRRPAATCSIHLLTICSVLLSSSVAYGTSGCNAGRGDGPAQTFRAGRRGSRGSRNSRNNGGTPRPLCRHRRLGSPPLPRSPRLRGLCLTLSAARSSAAVPQEVNGEDSERHRHREAENLEDEVLQVRPETPVHSRQYADRIRIFAPMLGGRPEQIGHPPSE